MAEGKRGRRKEIALAMIVIAGTVFATAVVLEIGLRFLGYAGAPESTMTSMTLVDDPILDWRYIPNSRLQIGRVSYEYNSVGFRGEEHKIEKPSGVERMLVIGDSVTEGYGVKWEDVFSSVVQAELAAGIEVINLGMGGINTPQEIHVLEKIGLRYAPDYVVLNFVLNDGDFFSSLKAARQYDNKTQNTIGLFGIRVSPETKRLLKSSALIYFLKDRIENLVGRLAGEEDRDYYSRIWASEANKAKVLASFDKLHSLSRENGFVVMVLIWPLLTDFRDYKFRWIHEWVASQAAAREFRVLDLLPAFSSQSFRSWQITSEDHVHPNVAGHKMAAKQFVGWFTR